MVILIGMGILVGKSVRNTMSSRQEPVSMIAQYPAGPTVQSHFIREDMIDFAILGFEKCGTTWLKEYVLGKSQHVVIPAGHSGTSEVHDLERDELDSFVDLFVDGMQRQRSNGQPSIWDSILHREDLGSSPALLRGNNGHRHGRFRHPLPRLGYKSPGGLKKEASLRNLEFFAPHLRLLVTTRHPVWWFQSIYNYKLFKKGHAPPPHTLIGHCGEDCQGIATRKDGGCLKSEGIGICTGAANFHHFLSRLGWTPMQTDVELDLLEHHQMSTYSFPKAQLFLMEQGQMNGRNLTVTNGLLQDLESFLDLPNQSLPRMDKTYRVDQYPSSQDHPREDALAAYNETYVKEHKISICDEIHRPIRNELIKIGSVASRWIIEFFLPSLHVVVSDRQDFKQRLRAWAVDPCD